MNKNLYPLLMAQFLSAFADNAILFTVIAIVLQSGNHPDWYIPALQSSFLIAFVAWLIDDFVLFKIDTITPCLTRQ